MSVTVREMSKPRLRYEIHWNGDRPYTTEIRGKIIDVYDKTDRLILQAKAKKVFIPDQKEWSEGNTILAKIRGDTYLFIGGSDIFTLEIPGYISDFTSQLIGSDIPYPIARTEDTYYLLLEKGIPIPITDDLEDPYDKYYRNEKNFPKHGPGYKKIPLKKRKVSCVS